MICGKKDIGGKKGVGEKRRIDRKRKIKKKIYRKVSNNLLGIIAVFIIFFTVFLSVDVLYKKSFNGYLEGLEGRATSDQGQLDVCVDIPPVFPVIGNLTAVVGKLFDHYVIAYDNEGDDVYFYDNTTIFNISETTGRILFTPNESNKGTHEIIITATDGVCTGINISQVFELTINLTSFTLNIPNLTATEDIEFYYDANATGGETPYNYMSNETWFEINFTTGEIEFTPGNDLVGNHRVMVEVVDNNGGNVSQEVNFSVVNTNDAPILDMDEDGVRDLMPNQTIMENSRFYYDVNATDIDLNVPGSTEKLYFQDTTDMFVIDEDTGIILFTADEPYTGNNSFFISVSDGEVIDSQKINFDIVWVNDMPVLAMETVFTHYASDGNFTYDIGATDEEDGGESTGNLTFWTNSTDLNISSRGVCEMEVNNSDVGNTYLFNVSVNDSQGGITSKIMSITVVATNRAPTIDTYEPEELNFTINEAQSIQFKITASDPDGTTPGISWYLDGIDTGETELNYSYATNYNSAGEHNITVFASDGDLVAAIEWNVSVKDVTPPTTSSAPSGGGGGGVGGGGRACSPVWVCGDWSICERTNLTMACIIQGIRGYECGVKTRTCRDINNCGIDTGKTKESKACIWTKIPNCQDGIQNQGEAGIDCGGPCAPCPTCHDQIQNQGEAGIDCGGPCAQCKKKYQIKEISSWISVIGFMIFFVVLTITIRAVYNRIKKYVIVYTKT